MEKGKKKSIIGWNWGTYSFEEEAFKFEVNDEKCLNLPYSGISLATANNAHEVAVEMNLDKIKEGDKGDYLSEIRFFLPANEEESNQSEAEGGDEEEKKEQSNDEEEKINTNENGKAKKDQKNRAQQFADNIIKKAGIGAFAGEIIAKLDNMQLLVPRGNYVFNLYSNYLKLHGKTHDYKILFKDINRAFLLPKPDGLHMMYVISLRSPLRQGQTAHNYCVIQFKKEREESLKLNISEEEINKKYGKELNQELEGPLYDILSRLFKSLIKISIIVPSGFKSEKDTDAVKCSSRAQDGYLYPLLKSFLFVHKPVAYIRHDDIKYLEFNRISEFAAAGRSFDINIVTKDNSYSFTGISKGEYKPLVEYLITKNIKVRNGDDEGKTMDLTNMDILTNPGRVNRRAMADIEEEGLEGMGSQDDSEGEDESFDIDAQEGEDSDLESNGSESLIEESDLEDGGKKKSKSKKKKTKKEE